MLRKILSLLLISSTCWAMQNSNWEKWDNELYHKHSGPKNRAYLRDLKRFDLSKENFQTILELGCHTGNVINSLAKKYPNKQFIGIDSQEDSIQFARKQYNRRKNIKLICAYPQQFDLENLYLSKADLIICYHLLTWIEKSEWPDIFEKINQNLSENGIAYIVTSQKQETTGLVKAVKKTIFKPKWWKYLPSFFKTIIKGQNKLTLVNNEEFSDLVSKYFKVQKCAAKEEVLKFKSREEFVSWLQLTLKPWGINKMIDKDRDEFINEAADLYIQEYNPGENGKIEYRFKALYLIVHKLS